MPRIWSDSLEGHRHAVQEAILDSAAELVQRGPWSVTMAQLAEGAGVSRATLYKYFPDVEAVLRAWHEREMRFHLDQLAELAGADGSALDQLTAVLRAYTELRYRRHVPDLSAAVPHTGEHVAGAEQGVHAFLAELVTAAAAVGEVRSDVAPGELATYCMAALAAAPTLPSDDAVDRLVAVTLDGLRQRR